MVSLLIQWFLVWKLPVGGTELWWIYNVVHREWECTVTRLEVGGVLGETLPPATSRLVRTARLSQPRNQDQDPRGGRLPHSAELAALSAQFTASFPDTVTVIIALFSNSHRVTFLKITSDGIMKSLCCLLPDVWNRFICLPSHRAELFLGLMQLPGGLCRKQKFHCS